MRLPHVLRGYALERGQRLGTDELESALGIWPNCNAGADLAEGVRCLIDLDVYVRVLEQANGARQAPDPAADDSDAEF